MLASRSAGKSCSLTDVVNLKRILCSVRSINPFLNSLARPFLVKDREYPLPLIWMLFLCYHILSFPTCSREACLGRTYNEGGYGTKWDPAEMHMMVVFGPRLSPLPPIGHVLLFLNLHSRDESNDS